MATKAALGLKGLIYFTYFTFVFNLIYFYLFQNNYINLF